MNTLEAEKERIFGPGLWSGRTSPEPSAQTKAQTSEPSSRKQRGSSSKKPPLFLFLQRDGQQPDASLAWEMGGGQFSIAWRVFDAQFWGVPQRRRRIALIADFGGLTGPEILFERESLSGDHPEVRTPWEGITAHAQRSIVRDDSVLEPGELTYCIQGNCIDRADTAGCNGKGWTEGVSYTLNTIDRPAVAFALENHPNDSRVKLSEGNVVQTLSSRMGTGGGNTPMILECYEAGNGRVRGGTYAMTTGCYMQINEERAATLCSRDFKDPQCVVYEIGNGQADQSRLSEVCGTLNCMHDQRAILHEVDEEGLPNHIVRRLTPMECERLQGFPDRWTDIGAWDDTNGKAHKESADGARYKALGNSIALPPWMYVLQRLSLACGPDHTMASLFDGIGGFPFIWEMYHGEGSCLWASEIEEFPMAVTRRQFNQEGGGET